MSGPLASLDRALAEFVDGVTSWQVELLRRAVEHMADGLDRDARAAIEGAREWRDVMAKRGAR